MYARLVDGLHPEARDQFDRDLNAPVGGWQAVQSRVLTVITGGADDDA